jgi:hypothetical protein
MAEEKQLTVEDHVIALGTPKWVEVGVRIREGYPDHFIVSEAAFKAACDRFLKGDTDGSSAPVVVKPITDAKALADAKAAADKAAADAKAAADQQNGGRK